MLRDGWHDTATYAGRDASGNYVFSCENGGKVVFTQAWVEAAGRQSESWEHDAHDTDGFHIRGVCPCLAIVRVVIEIYEGYCLCRDIRDFLIEQGWMVGTGYAMHYYPIPWITADIINGQVYYR